MKTLTLIAIFCLYFSNSAEGCRRLPLVKQFKQGLQGPPWVVAMRWGLNTSYSVQRPLWSGLWTVRGTSLRQWWVSDQTKASQCHKSHWVTDWRTAGIARVARVEPKKIYVWNIFFSEVIHLMIFRNLFLQKTFKLWRLYHKRGPLWYSRRYMIIEDFYTFWVPL